MYAYIDESGNTGAHLFDAAQPSFLNVAMSSHVDFDTVFRDRVFRIADSTPLNHLHGSELGLGGVESIARKISDLVDFSQVKFYFAFVNKPDVATMKFFDAVFDPGENPAAPPPPPPHVYVHRALKFILLLKFSTILTTADAKRFWDAMNSAPSPQAHGEAAAAIESVLQRIDTLPDQRSRQLIGETLTWAKDNITRLSMWNQRKRDRYGNLPNILTFPALMTDISNRSKIWGSAVEEIVHDQQSQFGTTLQQRHSLLRGFEPERIFHFGDTPIQFPDIGNSKFTLRHSRTSPGLQVVDIVLWIFARVVGNKPVGKISQELFDKCFSLDDMFIMSLSSMEAEVEYTVNNLMRTPLTEKQLADGKRILEGAEEYRQRRISDNLAE